MDQTKNHFREPVGQWPAKLFQQKYRVICQVGEGSYGKVFKACLREDESKIVAVKRFDTFERTEKSESVQFKGLSYFNFNEIQILRKLQKRCDNILQIQEVCQDEEMKHTFLICEYLEHDLRGITNKKITFNAEQLKCLLFQLFTGLNEIHKCRIIHRDIKLDNILYNNKGQLKICDFGLSAHKNKIPPGDFQYCKYKSPEVLLKQTYDEKIDIWSCGILLCDFLFLSQSKQGIFQDANIQQQQRAESSEQENKRQMLRIINKIGCSEQEIIEIRKMGIEVEQPIDNTLKLYLMKLKNSDEDLIDLISNMLVFDPKQRYSAVDCLNHPYFTNMPQMAQISEMPKFEQESKTKTFPDQAKEKAQVQAQPQAQTQQNFQQQQQRQQQQAQQQHIRPHQNLYNGNTRYPNQNNYANQAPNPRQKYGYANQQQQQYYNNQNQNQNQNQNYNRVQYGQQQQQQQSQYYNKNNQSNNYGNMNNQYQKQQQQQYNQGQKYYQGQNANKSQFQYGANKGHNNYQDQQYQNGSKKFKNTNSFNGAQNQNQSQNKNVQNFILVTNFIQYVSGGDSQNTKQQQQQQQQQQQVIENQICDQNIHTFQYNNVNQQMHAKDPHQQQQQLNIQQQQQILNNQITNQNSNGNQRSRQSSINQKNFGNNQSYHKSPAYNKKQQSQQQNKNNNSFNNQNKQGHKNQQNQQQQQFNQKSRSPQSTGIQFIQSQNIQLEEMALDNNMGQQQFQKKRFVNKSPFLGGKKNPNQNIQQQGENFGEKKGFGNQAMNNKKNKYLLNNKNKKQFQLDQVNIQGYHDYRQNKQEFSKFQSNSNKFQQGYQNKNTNNDQNFKKFSSLSNKNDDDQVLERQESQQQGQFSKQNSLNNALKRKYSSQSSYLNSPGLSPQSRKQLKQEQIFSHQSNNKFANSTGSSTPHLNNHENNSSNIYNLAGENQQNYFGEFQLKEQLNSDFQNEEQQNQQNFGQNGDFAEIQSGGQIYKFHKLKENKNLQKQQDLQSLNPSFSTGPSQNQYLQNESELNNQSFIKQKKNSCAEFQQEEFPVPEQSTTVSLHTNCQGNKIEENNKFQQQNQTHQIIQ